jgi:hypothetical protein
MANDGPLLGSDKHIPDVTRDRPADPDATVLSTRDHQLIWKWARERSAEPSTGEATETGPASSMKVADGGAGLRFNFPGFGRFRAIGWSEWFEHFDRHELTFVYERGEAGRPASARYRIVNAQEWNGRIG